MTKISIAILWLWQPLCSYITIRHAFYHHNITMPITYISVICRLIDYFSCYKPPFIVDYSLETSTNALSQPRQPARHIVRPPWRGARSPVAWNAPSAWSEQNAWSAPNASGGPGAGGHGRQKGGRWDDTRWVELLNHEKWWFSMVEPAKMVV